MSVTWTEAALSQLASVREYLARTNPSYATAISKRIIAKTRGLNGQPYFGAEVADYGNPLIREVYEHPYRIIYRVNGSDVEIAAVIHSSRRLPPTIPG